MLSALHPEVSTIYVSGWVTDRYSPLSKRRPTPREDYARTFWSGDLPLYQWKMRAYLDDRNLIHAVSPRMLAIETGMQDEMKLSGLVQVESDARSIYAAAGSEDALHIHRHEGSHEADVSATVSWFLRTLPLE